MHILFNRSEVSEWASEWISGPHLNSESYIMTDVIPWGKNTDWLTDLYQPLCWMSFMIIMVLFLQ